jgi:hypothetical protein
MEMSRIRFAVTTLALATAVSVAINQAHADQSATGTPSSEVTKTERAWEAKILSTDWMGLNPDGTFETGAHFLSAVKNGDYATPRGRFARAQITPR